MSTLSKLMLKTFLLAGFIYAILMAGFEYATENEFRFIKFVFNFLVFGLFMMFLVRYNYKKQQKESKNNNS